jgi:lysophospholipase L1-like esterase
MIRPGAVAIVLTCVLLLTSVAGRQVPTGAQEALVYVALGDSIAYGVGSSLPDRRGYPALLSEHLHEFTGSEVLLHNLAVPGETATSFLDNGQLESFNEIIDTLVEQRRTISYVTISLGGNEMLAQRYASTLERQQALGEFRSSLDQAVSRVKAEVGSNTTIVLTTYYDLSEGDTVVPSSDAWWIEEFNSVIRDVAIRYDARIANIDDAFRKQIDQLTLYPYDVHPNNQGYRAIARTLWSALALDTDAPEIHVHSSLTANRRTPTLRFEVTDASQITRISVTVGDSEESRPVNLGNGLYAMLLDLRGDDEREYVITIEAEDSAGNVGSDVVQLTLTMD